MTEVPMSHIVDAQKMIADGYLDLWELWLRNNAGVIYAANGPRTTWQGHVYDAAPMKLSSLKESATEEESRPTLTIFNPENVLASFVVTGALEKSIVKRKRVLVADIEQDNNIFVQRTWFIARPSSYLKGTLTVELRNLTDAPNFMMPRRQYIPPNFPLVSLS